MAMFGIYGVKRIFILGACLAAFSLSAHAQGRSMITGYVSDHEKRPVERAQIELTNETNFNVRRIFTEKSGRFTFNNLSLGRYSIRVSAPGTLLLEETQRIEISSGTSSGSETIQLDIQLKPRSTSAAAAAKVIFVQDVPDEAKRHYQNAVDELGRDDAQAAVVALVKALEIFPTYFSALEMLGVEYMKRQMYEDAVKAFGSAVRVNARSYDSWYSLGFAYSKLGMDKEAIEAAGKAIEIDRNSSPAFFVLGMSHRRLKAYNESEKAFLKAKEFDPESKTPDIHWNLALLYAHNLQKYGKAADELELFLKATPNNPDAPNIRKLIASFRAKQ